MNTVQTEDPSNSDDRARGCVIGAFCGDAIGAFLEYRTRVSDDDVEQAMQLQGGGPHKIGPGQITDDSELALCLAYGLIEGNGVLNLDEIANFYKQWIESSPFDKGATINNALSRSRGETSNLARKLRSGARGTAQSQSNGSLMRITPLCVWASKLGDDDIIRAVKEETKLTHSNKTVIHVSIIYVRIITHLLNNKGDNEGAYNAGRKMAERLNDVEILGWIDDEKKEVKPVNDHRIGWVKIAFYSTIFFLRKKTDYETAMREMLKVGGDTDTNCCIVGGMLGALHGLEGISEEIRSKVLSFDCTNKDDFKPNKGKCRPAFLSVEKNLENVIAQIIERRPHDLVLKGEKSLMQSLTCKVKNFFGLGKTCVPSTPSTPKDIAKESESPSERGDKISEAGETTEPQTETK